MSSWELWIAFWDCTNQEEAVALLSQYSSTTVQSTRGSYNYTLLHSAKDSITDYTLLHWAASSGWTRVCQLLTDKYQIDPDCRDTLGRTPLYCACITNKTDTVHYLVSNCYCDPLIKATNGRTAFDYSSGEIRDYLEDIIG